MAVAVRTTESSPRRGRALLPPETREAREKRLRLQQRLRELGLTTYRVAPALGISSAMLDKLLNGTYRTVRVLGYDQWATRVGEWLDDHEQGVAIMQRHAAQAAAEIEAAGLPLPSQLVACLPGKPRSRRARA